MRDRAIKDEPLCDQLKPFVTRNGWINHPLIVEMTSMECCTDQSPVR